MLEHFLTEPNSVEHGTEPDEKKIEKSHITLVLNRYEANGVVLKFVTSYIEFMALFVAVLPADM